MCAKILLLTVLNKFLKKLTAYYSAWLQLIQSKTELISLNDLFCKIKKNARYQ